MSVEIERGNKTYRATKAAPPGMTVAELQHWCIEQGLDPNDTVFTGGVHVTYMRTETDEERDRRVDAAERSNARHREWLRQRFAEEFGTDPS